MITPPTRPASTAGIIQYRPPPAFSRKLRPATPTSTAVTELGDARSMYRATPLAAQITPETYALVVAGTQELLAGYADESGVVRVPIRATLVAARKL